jgi:hypothetical protein
MLGKVAAGAQEAQPATTVGTTAVFVMCSAVFYDSTFGVLCMAVHLASLSQAWVLIASVQL